MLTEIRLRRKIKNALKKKWRDLQRRIRGIVQDLENFDDVTDYLRTIGHHFQL